MRNGILFLLLLVWACWGGIAGDVCAQAEAASPRTGPDVARSAGANTSVLLEPPPFIFSKRGRRDPFSPLFGGPEGSEKEDKVAKCTDQDIEKARGELGDLALACKNRNPGQFKAIYEEIMKKLNRPCENDELQIHALELKRRAGNLQHAMNKYIVSIGWEKEILWAEGQLQEMRKESRAQNLDALTRRYQDVKTRLEAKMREIDDQRTQKRMLDIIRMCAAEIRNRADDIHKDVLERGEKQIAKMIESLKKKNYPAVHTQYGELQTVLADQKFEEPALVKRQKKILDNAAEINRQAEIGEVKDQLAKAEDSLLQMDNTFKSNDYGAIAELNAKLQEYLGNIRTDDADLEDQRQTLKKRGADLERRAKICMEFLQTPPKISGIGWHPQNPVAIVNDKTVGLGDHIDQNTLIKGITPDTVVFTYKGENIERPMMGG